MRRDADVQTPIAAVGDIGSVGVLPSRSTATIGTWIAIECTLNDAQGIDAFGRAGHVDQVQVLERAQVAEIEDRAEVDVETFAPLAGEDAAAAGET